MDSELLDSSWQDISLPADEIVQRIAELRTRFQGEPQRYRPSGQKPEQLSATQIVDMSAAVQRFRSRLERVRAQLERDADLDSHPWNGVRNEQLEDIDLHYLPAALEVWQKALVDLGRTIFAFAKQNHAPAIARASMAELWAISKELSALPTLCGEEMWDYLGSLKGERLAQARACLDTYEKLLGLEATLSGKVLPWELLDLDAAHRHVKAGMLLSQNLAPAPRLSEVRQVLDTLPALEERLKGLEELVAKLQEAFGEACGKTFDLSPAGLKEIATLLDLVNALPQKYWYKRDPVFENEAFDGALAELRQGLEALAGIRAGLDALFLVEHLPPVVELRRLQKQLAQAGKLKWVDKDWRAARDKLYAFAAAAELDLETLVKALPQAIEYREALDALNARKDLREALGPLFAGEDTDLHALTSLRAWYVSVRKEYGAGIGPRVALGEQVLQLPPELANALRQMTLHQSVPLSQHLAELDDLQAVVAKTHPLKQERCDLFHIETGLLAFAGCVRQGLEMVESLVNDEDLSIADIHARIDAHRSLNRDYAKWQRFRADNRLFSALALDLDAVGGTSELAKARATLELAEALERLSASDIAGAVLRHRDADHYKGVMRFARSLPELLEEERRQREGFADLARLDIKAWLPRHHSVKAIHDRNKRALAAEDTLRDWLELVRAGIALKSMGLESLSEALVRQELSPEQAQTALQAGVYDLLASAVLDDGAEDAVARLAH